eukprot:6688191-Lingulodinium_polyedra.AAC.1
MLKELQTWAKLKFFSRRPRQGARNVIDVRWVNKFKWEQPIVDVAEADSSGGVHAEASQFVRTIRARLT